MARGLRTGDRVKSKIGSEYVVKGVRFDGTIDVESAGGSTYVRQDVGNFALVEPGSEWPTGIEIAEHLEIGGTVRRPASASVGGTLAQDVTLADIAAESGCDEDAVLRSWRSEAATRRWDGWKLLHTGRRIVLEIVDEPPRPPLPPDMTVEELAEAVDRLTAMLDDVCDDWYVGKDYDGFRAFGGGHAFKGASLGEVLAALLQAAVDEGKTS